MRYFVVLFLFVNQLAYANSLFEKLESKFEKMLASKSKQTLAKAKHLPTDMPTHWQYSYLVEPNFNAELAVLETGMQHKQSIILVHGLGSNGMKDWYEVIPELAKRYHVIAFDLPGFGHSGVPKGVYTPTNYAKVVKSVADARAKNTPIVIGHSMGGAVSLRYASMFPAHINKLVLIDTAGILQKTAFLKHSSTFNIDGSELPNKLDHKLDKTMAQLNDLSSSIIESTTLNRLSQFMEETFTESDGLARPLLVKNNPNLNAAFGLVEEDFSQAVYETSVHTEVLWGEVDKVAPLRTGKVLASNLPSANLQVIANAGHVPMHSHTEEFLTQLNTALNRHTKSVTGTLLPDKTDEDKTNILTCDNQDNLTFSGVYQTISIKGCTNIKLSGIKTNKLVIQDSLVSIDNIDVASSEIALNLHESVVNITNGKLSGKNTIYMDGSRLDLAGVELKASETSIKAKTKSSIIMSISKLESPAFQGYAHGAFKLTKKSIEDLLNKQG